MEKDFDVKKNGSALVIELINELSANNAPLLIEEMSKFANQDIQRVVFNATGLIYISSSGLRTVFYAYQDLGDEPEIVFVNCVKEIRDVLTSVGIAQFIKFEENDEMKKEFRKRHLTNLSKENTASLIAHPVMQCPSPMLWFGLTRPCFTRSSPSQTFVAASMRFTPEALLMNGTVLLAVGFCCCR